MVVIMPYELSATATTLSIIGAPLANCARIGQSENVLLTSWAEGGHTTNSCIYIRGVQEL